MTIPLYKKQILACMLAGAIALAGCMGGIMEPLDAGNESLQEPASVQTLDLNQEIGRTNFELENR